MTGDGDLDGKVWAAMKASGLVIHDSNAAMLIDGVLKSGRKVTRDVLTLMVKKYPYVLHVATEQSLDAVKCLVEAGADVNKQDGSGCTPLYDVSDPAIAQYLVESRADVNMRDSSGWTPLHHVSEVAVAQYLVESKADPSIRDNEGRTPLRYESTNNGSAVADYLRSIGAPE
jgi:hypothetical protein